MKDDKIKEGEDKIKGIMLPPVKLKDGMSPTIDLKRVFGFIPEKILVLKVSGRNNWYQIFAVFTEEALKKVEEAEKERDEAKKMEILKLNKKTND